MAAYAIERLVVRRAAGEVVGAGALKPVDDATAEIKRMYIRRLPGATVSAARCSTGC